MSEARDRYKEVDPWKENNRAIFIDYIEELEHQITELKESQKQKRIIRLCERLDKAEQQKAELIKTLNNWLISFKSTLRKQEYQVETFNILNDRYIESAELLKKHGVEI